MSLSITPETKIGELLEAYPQVEETLISLAPAFTKLKNPLLRKTVAKLATLEQAAAIAGIHARDLVSAMRKAAGQVELPVLNAAPPPRSDAGSPPAWLQESRVCHEIDADKMLETGEHPIGRVRAFAQAADRGDILKLTSSFRPTPLAEGLRRTGVEVYEVQIAPGKHVTYFCPKPDRTS